MQRLRALWRNERYRELFMYCVVGGMTTLVNIAAFYVCAQLMGIHHLIATNIAWVASVAFAFPANKIWVFRSRNWALKQLWYELGSFVAARVLTQFIDTGLMALGVDLMHANEMAVKVVANVVVIAFNYVASRWVIFRKKEK